MYYTIDTFSPYGQVILKSTVKMLTGFGAAAMSRELAATDVNIETDTPESA